MVGGGGGVHVEALLPVDLWEAATGGADNFNSVEAVGSVGAEEVVLGKPVGGRFAEELAFGFIYGEEGAAVGFVLTGLNLDEEKDAFMSGNNVNFAASEGASVASEDGTTVDAEKAFCPAFAPGAGGEGAVGALFDACPEAKGEALGPCETGNAIRHCGVVDGGGRGHVSGRCRWWQGRWRIRGGSRDL